MPINDLLCRVSQFASLAVTGQVEMCVVPCSGLEDYTLEIHTLYRISMESEESEDFFRIAVFFHRLHLFQFLEVQKLGSRSWRGHGERTRVTFT